MSLDTSFIRDTRYTTIS